MITEIADFKVAPESRDAFIEAISRGIRTILSRSTGYRHHQLLVCQESPGRLVLVVQWDSLEAHTVGFRQSPAFAEWRAVIGPFFLQPPHVEHFEAVTTG